MAETVSFQKLYVYMCAYMYHLSIYSFYCGRQNRIYSKICALISGVCGYFMLHGKRELSLQIELRFLIVRP